MRGVGRHAPGRRAAPREPRATRTRCAGSRTRRTRALRARAPRRYAGARGGVGGAEAPDCRGGDRAGREPLLPRRALRRPRAGAHRARAGHRARAHRRRQERLFHRAQPATRARARRPGRIPSPGERVPRRSRRRGPRGSRRGAPLPGPMMLSATDLRAGYGANLVLQGAQFALGEGSICGIIGPNGAGKTTLLRSLYGLLPLQSGEVRFDGRDITRRSPGARLRAGVGCGPQEPNVSPNLAFTENLELGLIAFAPAERARRLHGRLEKIFALFPRLAERRGQLAGLMSGGEQRMVALGIGLMAEPRVLFLDEPTTGLAPLVVHQLMATIKALNRDGLSTVVVEQNVLSLLDIVDELYLVKAGRCTRYEGDPRSLGQQKIWEYM